VRLVVLDFGARFGALFGTLRTLGVDRVDGVERGTERARGTERGAERGTVRVPVPARGSERGSTRVRAAVPGCPAFARALAARSARSEARVAFGSIGRSGIFTTSVPGIVRARERRIAFRTLSRCEASIRSNKRSVVSRVAGTVASARSVIVTRVRRGSTLRRSAPPVSGRLSMTRVPGRSRPAGDNRPALVEEGSFTGRQSEA
jgi:hypothetical protein